MGQMCDGATRLNKVDFHRDIRPILVENCFQCHGPDEVARKGNLRLDLPEGTQAVITPGQPDASKLMQRVTARDPSKRMPPTSFGQRLSDSEQQKLALWIEQGAVYEPHWAFISPSKSRLPAVNHTEWVQNEIDCFILHRLEQEGLPPSPPADAAALARRVTLDLTGLPPTTIEMDRYLADFKAGAYERLVDRLLSSPRYGEHMAVFWLEASRYADTDGYQNDRTRYHHVWRDWVIMAFNENNRYDDFVVEQLAGDMLSGATLRHQVATGFCRNHRINSEDGTIPDEWHVENVVDRVDTFGTVFLGLTVGCARCHDHKFDPISQREYYELFAYFNNVPEWGVGPNNGNSPPFVQIPKSWPHLTAQQNRFFTPEPVQLRREEEEGSRLDRPQSGPENTVMVMHELELPRPTYRLQRGQYNLPDLSERLFPGVPESLHPNGEALPSNRLELAEWLVDPGHPLTARVAVNRFWQNLFGVGLVQTSENFGTQGDLPSHAKLLDWLAVEFVHNGWNVKALLREIVMSSTYRQSSIVTQDSMRRDPENRLIGHGPRFRLPAFVIRDQALAVSGLLVNEIGGPSVKPYMPPKIWKSFSNNAYESDQGASLYRRSLYTYWRRTIPPPTMVNFNAANREVCSVRTERTNTPLQALTLMNNMTFVEASRFLAERMIRQGGDNVKGQVQFGYRMATAREPNSEQTAVLIDAHQRFYDHFESEPQSAQRLLKIGEKLADATLDPVTHAAMTVTASLILNLDEVITKE
ncbi:MAG: PSD1 and planctomycete cytochrome C domain-containing protein [Pirellulaceae bacterium]|nr:PSD1 and planctomycete cytochrome C domain-containing protein [Pirellulaceae bacterium]